MDALSRAPGVEIDRLEEWPKRALAGIEGSRRERATDHEQIELAGAMKRIGELSMDDELLRAKNPRLFCLSEIAATSATIFPATGHPHGVERERSA